MIDGEPQGGADFRAVLAAAKDIDDAAETILTGEKPQQIAVEVIDPAEAWADIPRKVGSLLSIVAPELREVYTDEACKDWGGDMHRLATKRGWSAEGLPPEVAAGISTAGLLLPTFAILKAKRDAMRKAHAQAQGEGAIPQNVEIPGADGQGA